MLKINVISVYNIITGAYAVGALGDYQMAFWTDGKD
jgi:hypothetical protein